jgi:pilus assembly protein Flp/PilA
MEKLVRFLKDEEGVTAIEYGLIAALIAVTIIVVLTATGDALQRIFGRVSTGLNSAASS